MMGGGCCGGWGLVAGGLVVFVVLGCFFWGGLLCVICFHGWRRWAVKGFSVVVMGNALCDIEGRGYGGRFSFLST